MIAFHSPRLTALFGNIPLDRLSAEDIERAVQRGALREDEDLEFKQRITLDTDVAKAEFAKDVAALANARGGLILVGVRETKGVADEVRLVDADEEFPKRLYFAVANWLAPTVEFGVHFAPKSDDLNRGFYLVTVPPSPSTPHAVRTQQRQGAWLFPRRLSSDTHFMSESEIADAYRNRFRGMEEQGERLEAVLRNGRLRLHQMYAWACMALVPNALGRLTLDQERIRALANWATTVSAIPPSDGPFEQLATALNSSTRAGRVTLGVAYDHAGVTAENRQYAELYADGSGFVALPLGYCDVLTPPLRLMQLILFRRPMVSSACSWGMLQAMLGWSEMPYAHSTCIVPHRRPSP